MRLKVNKNLTRLEIIAEKKEISSILGGDVQKDGREITVAKIKNPVLMTDPFRIGRFDSITRDTLFQLYGSFPRVTEYEGVESVWDPSRHVNVWCPSIDTLFFARALLSLIRKTKIKSAMDLGCGSGFLGQFILEKSREFGRPLKKLDFVDINPEALRCAMDNTEKKRGETTVSYLLNKAGEGIRINGEYDLLICNPPYIPRPIGGDDNPFEGLSLIKELSEKGPGLLTENGLMIINISSLCEETVLPWLKKNFEIKSVGRLRVPLKVLPVINNRTSRSRRWLKYLKNNPGLQTDKKEKSGYRYWHRLNLIIAKPI